MAKQINIKIDGQSITTEEGKNLVDVANEAGIFIPQLCYYPHMEHPLGTCRVCACEINGRNASACMTLVKDGMEVSLHTPELKDRRKAIVEMMFAEGNHFCPACEKSGNCDLQHMGYQMGITHARFAHLFKDRLVDFSPKRMVIEHNRCVKCHRCVEEVLTKEGKKVFSNLNRGNETVVGIDYKEEAKLTEEELLFAMHLCPTGAILVRGESLTQPYGDRKFDNKTLQDTASDANTINPTISKDNKIQKPLAYSSKGKVAKTKNPASTVGRQEPRTKNQEPRTKNQKLIATTSLAGCFGCHMSMLDVDLGLLDLIELVNFDKSPLTDIKEFSKTCDIGLIEGGCCNAENIEVLKEFRKKCKILVSVGECAIWGGVPAMRNTVPLEECLEEAYLNCVTTDPGETKIPYHEDLPKILDKVYPCHEIVKIDYHIPGCPPSPNHIWKAVKNLLWGEDFSILYSEFKYD